MEQPLSRTSRYAVIAGTVLVTGIFTFGAVRGMGSLTSLVTSREQEDERGQVQNVNGNAQNTENTPNALSPSSETTALTMAEVAKHNTAADCWFVISGKVYDVTSFIPTHPGGAIMAKSCGTEATQAFATQGGRGDGHSSRAENMLAQYSIGDLNQSVSSGALQQAQQNATAKTPAGGGGWDDDGEDEEESESEREDD